MTTPARATLDDARAVLTARFGYPDFRPPQRGVVDAILAGHDVLVVLPTGGGKSLCYQVPALLRTGLTVIVSPLISLMKDQVEALLRRGIRAAYINSTLTTDAVASRLAQARDGALTMLYLAPERLASGRTAEQLAAIGVGLLAVDEAHCIAEWGHDFRPSYRRLGEVRARLAMPQTVALTATATPDVRVDIGRQLALRNPITIVGGFDRTNLSYHVVPAQTRREKDTATVRWIRRTNGATVVYTPTRTAVEQVTAMLVRARVKATAYHGGLDDMLRQRAQDAFMQGRAQVIVATSAFGMGIDKPDVRLVVHHAMPGSLEAYYQEAGRAGRDGMPGECVLLHAPADRRTHEYFMAGSHPTRQDIERTWRTLDALADATGTVTRPASRLREDVRGVEPRRVDAALRVLTRAGACRAVAATSARVWLQLIATPERIRRELAGADHVLRDFLRACWEVAGDQLVEGTHISLAQVTRALRSPMALVPLLEQLEARQFVTWTRTGEGLHLDPRCRVGASLLVDWSALERRRHADRRRLDAMERYAQTRDCRRAFVLRYFGDPDARPDCGACDRCLRPPPTRLLPACRSLP